MRLSNRRVLFLLVIAWVIGLLNGCAKAPGTFRISSVEQHHYSQRNNERDRGVLYLPENHNSNLMVVVHGGGWQSRDLHDMDGVATSLASHGYLVFTINYRLAPEFHHPAPAEDLGEAIGYVQHRLQELGIQVKHLGLWGYSSGAHTVSYYALKYALDLHLPKPDVVVTGGAPMNLTWYPLSPYCKAYFGFYRDENLDAYIEASPAFHVTKEAPPFFLYHALDDELVEAAQSAAFQAQLLRVGVKNRRFDVKHLEHATTLFFSSQAIAEGIKFVDEVLLRP